MDDRTEPSNVSPHARKKYEANLLEVYCDDLQSTLSFFYHCILCQAITEYML